MGSGPGGPGIRDDLNVGLGAWVLGPWDLGVLSSSVT